MIEREKAILHYMIEKQELVTRQELAELLHVSVSTIRDDLKTLELTLHDHSIKLIHIRGSGIKLDGHPEALDKLREQLLLEQTDETDSSVRLIYYLLTYRKNYIKLNDLADQLYLSRSAIQSELEKLKPLLDRYQIQLQFLKGKGVRLEGSEKQLRSLFGEVICRQSKILDPYGFKSSYKSIQENIAAYLNIETDTIHRYLQKMLETVGIKMSDNAFNNLLIHVMIAIVRIKQGYSLAETDELIDENTPLYQAVKTMTEALEKAYRICFSPSEINLIYQYLISSNDTITHQPIVDDELHKRCLSLAKEIIHLIEDTRHFTIQDDHSQNYLLLHLLPLANRIRTHRTLKNPMLAQIKQEYPDAFGMAWMCNSLFKQYLEHFLNEDELAYLAIHIERMIEQEEPPIRTILVCSQGIGVSQLLALRIQSTFRKLKIIDVIAEHHLHEYDLAHIDLCIATYPIQTALPKIIISPLISQNDCRRIQNFIDDYSNRSVKLFNVVALECLLNQTVDHEKQLIQIVSKKLHQAGYVNESFYQNVIDREQKCSTSIGFKTAIPHASPDTVHRSVICLTTLKQPILWGNDEVDLILFLAIHTDDIHKINLKLRQLYQLLYQNVYHERICHAQSTNEIKEILKL